MWYIPRYVRYVVHTKICPVCVPHQLCPVCGPHQRMSGMWFTPRYVRYVFHTNYVRYVVHTKECPMVVPHQTCHVALLDWGKIMFSRCFEKPVDIPLIMVFEMFRETRGYPTHNADVARADVARERRLRIRMGSRIHTSESPY